MAARWVRAAIRSAVANGYGGLRPAEKWRRPQWPRGGMDQRLERRQARKAAGSLDGMNQAKNIIQDFRVVRILLEPHQLVVDGVETLVGLRQELPQQIIHQHRSYAPARDIARGLRVRPVSSQSV
jgi:hypothetical protein